LTNLQIEELTDCEGDEGHEWQIAFELFIVFINLSIRQFVNL